VNTQRFADPWLRLAQERDADCKCVGKVILELPCVWCKYLKSTCLLSLSKRLSRLSALHKEMVQVRVSAQVRWVQLIVCVIVSRLVVS